MGLGKLFCKGLLKLHGWNYKDVVVPKEAERCMFVFAPHTSNWDWYFGTLHMIAWGLPIKVVIKESWLRFPLGLILKPLGAVGVNRGLKNYSSKKEQFQRLASVFKQHEKIAFIITPEGSRSPRKRWKTGFYQIAKKANVPIVTLTSNFPAKKAWFGPVYYPDQELEEVMTSMMDFFSKSTAVHPDNFALDERYYNHG